MWVVDSGSYCALPHKRLMRNGCARLQPTVLRPTLSEAKEPERLG